ncbi:unnamed protein product [Prunus armeniaca]
MFVVATRLWSQNLPAKSFVETVSKCIVAFIEYHDTPKMLKMVSELIIHELLNILDSQLLQFLPRVSMALASLVNLLIRKRVLFSSATLLSVSVLLDALHEVGYGDGFLMGLTSNEHFLECPSGHGHQTMPPTLSGH